jgi:DNA-binding transcriptional LysR family regulator
VPTIIAREILPSLASRFLAAHPGITLDITANDSFIDVLAAGFDAGIRYDERIERDMIAGRSARVYSVMWRRPLPPISPGTGGQSSRAMY